GWREMFRGGERAIAPRTSSRRGAIRALRSGPPSADGTVRSRASRLSAARRGGGKDAPARRVGRREGSGRRAGPRAGRDGAAL
ncbi:MAG: hypothetical protein AVDCRST_MAG77-5923, partial [uncultured Chloroflexi bacterium]